MSPAIPDRWLNYKPIGERILGTRFIAFKVPLRVAVNKNVNDEDQRLDGSILLQNIPELGIVIDLTNTDRYYEPDIFVREGVQYQKLMIPGHATPPDYLVKRFKTYVTNFLKCNKNNDKLIGVHCTHGVNRTGFLICNYMISEMDMTPEEAIKRFNNARGHNIERGNYLEALNGLSDTEKSQSTPPVVAPETPIVNWRAHKEPTPAEPVISDRRDRFERCRADATLTRTHNRNDKKSYKNERNGSATRSRYRNNYDNAQPYRLPNTSMQRFNPYERINNVYNNNNINFDIANKTSHRYDESSSRHSTVPRTYREYREQRERERRERHSGSCSSYQR